MEKILVLDFGGQYNQLIARRVRNQNVYAEIKSYDKVTVEEIAAQNYKGIIFTGGPNSVYGETALRCDRQILHLGVPVLGICYGCQLIAYLEGGHICPAENSGEYGKVELTVRENPLFKALPEKSICWMSHNDMVRILPDGFKNIAYTDKCPNAALCCEERNLYGVQFHPEVTHTRYGNQILHNFLFEICHCSGDWKMDDFIDKKIAEYKEQFADKKVLCGLSGGVDSSVAALLLHKAIGQNLTCVFVDHGLLRKNEGKDVERIFRQQFNMNLVCVKAEDRFLSKLKGVTEPEQKRKIIGEEFIRVFEAEAKKLGKTDYLAQGTIYPDVVESGKGDASTIKSHHNVGGLPDVIDFDGIVEPLRDLFKDEVRSVGRKLGLPDSLVDRQPFPGPGLAVRIIGEITKEKADLLREVDAIFRDEIALAGYNTELSQYFAVLTDTRSVGVKGDARTYGYTVALRAVRTDDFMTADWAKIPYELLEKISNRITNEVGEVTRVVYDITSKPPATIEWE